MSWIKDLFLSRRSLAWGALIFAVWTILALFFTSQDLMHQSYSGLTIGWQRVLAEWLLCSWVWAALTAAIVPLARRFPFERGKVGRALAVHLPASVLISAVHLGVYVFLGWMLFPPASGRTPFETFRLLLRAELNPDFYTYWAIVSVTHAVVYATRLRDRDRREAQLEVRAAQLEARLALAQLDSLKMQLHPHFLFNTLNAISVLMADDVEAARRMLLRLSDLLRIALRDVDTHEVPLRRELEFLEAYLEIERIRFGNRLDVALDVAPDALDAPVPTLILQPIVENAIKHGIAPFGAAGRIEIHAHREGDSVELRVSDNGPGTRRTPPRKSESAGIGLANTAARLEQLYGGRSRFEAGDGDGGGFVVKIAVPYRPGAAAHA